MKTFMVMLMAGICVGACYDLYRHTWLRKYQRSWLKHFGDFSFLLLTAAFIVLLLFLSNWIQLRSYVFIGLGCGIFTYYKIFKGIFAYLSRK